MFPSGLLILSLPPKHLVARLRDVLSEASRRVQNTLYIKVDHRQNLMMAPKRIDSHNLCHLVPQIYSQATRYCSHLDVRVLQTFSNKVHDHHISGQFQVVLSDSSLNLKLYLRHQFNVDSSKLTVHSKTDFIGDDDTNNANCKIPEETLEDSNMNTNEKFEFVCLGGTFDRLHNGHKVLLGEAINLCSKELIIGVTDGVMIKNKVLYELIEPAQDRMNILTSFLKEVNPGLLYKVEPIYDPFGPAITLPQLQCIVVSQETKKGGLLVNQKRAERDMAPLHIHEISLVEDRGPRESESEEEKLSSSSLRRRCLATLLREPKPNPSLQDLPYLIGLTGGIASGKSSIGRRLQDLGAGLLDCDQLAHISYARGTPTYSTIVQEFGRGILAQDESIDRKLLGNAVFQDEAKREKLNSIVWPAVTNLAQSRVKFLHESGHSVVILEAALLIEAGWQQNVHQVWVATIPEKEAVRRVVTRDGLTEGAALSRVQSQMSNADRVAHAHLLFCTLWDPQETKRQVEKAWSCLKEYLRSKNICRL